MSTQASLVWEQRWHPVREEWVLYTSHRGGRPWIGDTHAPAEVAPPSYDPTCALCPGNKRLMGENPSYTGAYCFTNDLPTFSNEAPAPASSDELYKVKGVTGTAEVICYHPNHAKTFVDLTDEETHAVVEVWRERYVELGARPEIENVLIFENKGSLVGTSNPYPPCQIYAANMVYGHTAQEVERSRRASLNVKWSREGINWFLFPEEKTFVPESSRAGGWQRAAGLITVPGDATQMGLLLAARHQQSEADTVLFDNLAAYDVDELLQGKYVQPASNTPKQPESGVKTENEACESSQAGAAKVLEPLPTG
jgi:hypothetical protein